MIDSPRPCSVSLLLPEGQGGVRHLCGSEVQSSKRNCCGGHDVHTNGYREASMKRGQLVSRRSRQSQRLCPSSLLRIESAYRHRP